jgi:hypothetical protein
MGGFFVPDFFFNAAGGGGILDIANIQSMEEKSLKKK